MRLHRFSPLVAPAAALVSIGFTAAASAGLVPSMDTDASPTDNGDGTFSYVYNLTFVNAQDGLNLPVVALDPQLDGNMDGDFDDAVDGSFITFYDFGGFVSASTTDDFSLTVNDTGVDGFGTFPVQGDDADLENVTAYYTGDRLTESRTFTGFLTVVSTSGLSTVESYTGQDSRNSPQAAAATPVGSSGLAIVPAAAGPDGPGTPIPTPSAALGGLLGLGAVALRRRAAARA